MIVALILAALSVTPAYTNVNRAGGAKLMTNIVEWADAVESAIEAVPSGTARPLPRYLHALDFCDSYANDAAWYYAQPQDYGACSAVRDGGFLYRNYDWKFDETAEFVVRMTAGPGRFASIGVANCGTNLTEDVVTSGKASRYYKCLPGRVVDGINENGVVCEVNVVGGVPPLGTGGDIHPLAAVRWALDNGTSAGMVASNLADRIAFPEGWTKNFHWMVADAQETWIVENGAAHLVGDASVSAVMTNFRLFPTPDDYGDGQERYAILTDTARPITDAWFTRCYKRETTPPWVSDLTGLLAYTNAIYDAWAAHDREFFRDMAIDGKRWWQTVHTSIYDITNRTLRIAVQETPDWYVFAVPSAGGVKPEAVREIVEPMIGDATNGLRRVEDLAVYQFKWVPQIDISGFMENEERPLYSDDYEHDSDVEPHSWNCCHILNGKILLSASWGPLNVSAPRDASELTFVGFDENFEQVPVTFKKVAVTNGDTIATSNSVNEAIGTATNGLAKTRLPSWLTASAEEPRGKTDLDVYERKWTLSGDVIPGSVYVVEENFKSDEIEYCLFEDGVIFAYFYTETPVDRITFTNFESGRVIIAVRGLTTTGSKLAHTSATSGLAKFGAGGELTAASEGLDYTTPQNVEAQIAAGIAMKQDKITASGVLKGDGYGGVAAAKKSSVDGAEADYRDPKDNVCHETELGEWAVANIPEGLELVGQPSKSEDEMMWIVILDGEPSASYGDGYTPQIASSDFYTLTPREVRFTATRSPVCTEDETFVTQTFVTNEVATATKDAVTASTVTNIINAKVSANMNTYVDGETGVEYVGKIYEGNLYYVPTGNVFPPNEND